MHRVFVLDPVHSTDSRHRLRHASQLIADPIQHFLPRDGVRARQLLRRHVSGFEHVRDQRPRLCGARARHRNTVEPQLRFLFLRPMTLHAVLSEERSWNIRSHRLPAENRNQTDEDNSN